MYRSIPHDPWLRIDRFPAPEEDLLAHVDAFVAGMRAEAPVVLGFPANLNFSYSHVAGLLDILVNNVGDPTSNDKSAVGAKHMELAVVEYMAELANADPVQTYGYLAGGGSEANQFGLDRGCTMLPEAAIYCSRAAHYSIRKSARLMRRELVVLDADEYGRMDIEQLHRVCRRDHGRGAVVLATVGTTMTGATDDVDAIAEAAAPAGEVYVHLDAALGGLIAPFTQERDRWGFANPAVGSVAVSMHKALGMPVPCAVALCRWDLAQAQIQGEYVNATDATLSCSRNGLASVLVWYALARKGTAGLARNAWRALDLAQYAADRFHEIGMNPLLNPLSVVVVFDRPSEWVCRRFHLATEGARAHIVTVGHVTTAMIDELCEVLAADAEARRFEVPGHHLV
ncbi:aminotransferase class I/II-fold pyridoxal phosphate-dependent enzyme [Nocardia sp. 2]|uniref:Aminotransferase class I/II-fold pyridoxal phosphate-dependent enzyme n=1 Tax=Nocardia acididurans TaxID=2802282 RepID=A0ABS1MGK4_9NOCA|nr:aminotransferase class I/II-fold pyridoxal phosphate-dependent enzyme [Nocardia acididurans]MBL1079742.1 aminotransferase class I/II-fold pyridoxal phosphate-dependent enzyme [Nocardia acididurans]